MGDIKIINLEQKLEKTKCCICGCTFYGNGHDTRPIKTERGSVCCDICNKEVVAPTRKYIAKKNVFTIW